MTKRPFPFRAAALVAALTTVVALAACSTPDPTQFHSLLTPPGAAETAPTDAQASADSTPLFYDFAPVTIPQQVSQPQFVIRNPDNTLTMLERQRWIAPLSDEIRAAIGERLSRRYKEQQSRGALPNERAVMRLNVDVMRFEAMPGREIRVEATWTLKTTGDNPVGLRCHTEVRQSVGAGYEAMTAGYRSAMTLLADDIGPAMQALRRGQSVCR